MAGSARNGHKGPLSNGSRRGSPSTSRPSPPAAAATQPHHDVFLGFLAGNTVTASFDKSLRNLWVYDGASGEMRLHKVGDGRAGPLQLIDGRNKLCQATLDSGCQWLWMVDSDMGFEPDTLSRLLAVADPVERPVVGALCFSLREAGADGYGGMVTFASPTILMWQDDPLGDGIGRFVGPQAGECAYPANSMIRVGATGAACILIHRSVLEKMGGHWYDQIPVGDGTLEGEDISFCHRMKDLDIPLWIHTGIRTTHMKTIWLGEQDYWQMRIAQPATERVDIIIPALHRPQNVKPLMESLRASTALATAWWVIEPDDDEEREAVTAAGGQLFRKAGTFAQKVNTAYLLRQPGWVNDLIPMAPWILLVGDDVRFHPGWLDKALEVANRWDADVVGTNDLLNPRVMRGEHATHMLIRRSYIDEIGSSWDGPGIVAHEGYHHWYVDDEIVMAAKLRGRFQAALGSHVQHFHPMNGTTPMDEIYELGTKHVETDKALFTRRLKDAVRAGSRPKVLV